MAKSSLASFQTKSQSAQRIGLDTNCFIYLWEQHPHFEPMIKWLFNTAPQHNLRLITSVITVSEILHRPFCLKKKTMVQRYIQTFKTIPFLTIQEINFDISVHAANLSAQYHLRLPDALQISASLKQRATIFLTNDKKLKRIKEIEVVCLNDY